MPKPFLKSDFKTADRDPMKKKKANKIDFDLKPFHDMVVFDLETTGLSTRFDDIIQIAAVRIFNGEIIEKSSYFSFIKPSGPISDFITAYTGISNEHVKNAPLPKKVLLEFSKYCKDSLLVAHNGQAFDLPFVRNVCERNKMEVRAVESVDSMHISWNVWGRKNVKSHNLDNVMNRLNITEKGIRRHDARGDVIVTAKCVQQMVKEIKKTGKEISLNVNTSYLPVIKS